MALRVVERLARREEAWKELDGLLDVLEQTRTRRYRPDQVLRLGELYRSACTDLMLAEAHDLPREAVDYLHGLVGRAHNALYRAQGFRFSDWAVELFGAVPRRLRGDPALRVAALAFWFPFLLCTLLAAGRDEFAAKVVGEPMLEAMDRMYSEPIGASGGKETGKETVGRNDTTMAGFYILHNASIGLQCFAGGLFLGLGSLYALLFNGIFLGTVFGHMARGPNAANFFTFVTAHGPFELTAVVFSGAAGLRLGWGLIDTRGRTRLASLRREAARALPTVGAAVLLFVLAAFLEGFVSPSALPYRLKAAIALFAAALLVAYLALGGRGREDDPEMTDTYAPAKPVGG